MKSSIPRPAWSSICVSLFAALLMTPDARAQGATQSPALELVGIHVGMSHAEAEAVLRKRGLSVRVGTDMYFPGRPFPTQVVGQSPTNDASKPRELVRIWLTAPPSEPTVISIFRSLQYPTNGGPEPESLAGALKEKFGEPVQVTLSPYKKPEQMYWNWDADGKSLPPDRRRFCPSFLYSLVSNQMSHPFTSDFRPEKFAGHLKVGCHRGAIGWIQSLGGVRANGISTGVFDLAAADVALKKSIEYKLAEQQTINQKSRAEASKVKPDL